MAAPATNIMTRNEAFFKLELNPDTTTYGAKRRRYEFNHKKSAWIAQQTLNDAFIKKGRILGKGLQAVCLALRDSYSSYLVKEILKQAYVDREGNYLSLCYKNDEFKKICLNKLEEIKKLNKKNNILSIEADANSFLQLAVKKETRTLTPISGIGKTVAKLGSEGACKMLYKQAGVIAKQSGKKFAEKQMPGLALLTGIGLGAYRLNKGEPGKAALEVISGISALFLGIGTVFSVAIDTGLLYSDVASEKPVEEKLDSETIEQGKRLFGLDNSTPITESSIRAAFRNSSQAFHPDRYAEFPALRNRCTKVQKSLEKAKDILIKHVNNQ
ncbi:MAG: hypothetical protein AAF443_04795 [Chlamydiota bacterium]